VEGFKYTIIREIPLSLSLVFFSVRFPEELHWEGGNSSKYAGALLGSGFRISTPQLRWN
jgi:hypothetical protein